MTIDTTVQYTQPLSASGAMAPHTHGVHLSSYLRVRAIPLCV